MARRAENFPHSEWQRLYLDALTETDKTKLAEKLYEAEFAIFDRLQKMSTNPDSEAEKAALADAIRGLRVLQQERLLFPDWT